MDIRIKFYDIAQMANLKIEWQKVGLKSTSNLDQQIKCNILTYKV
jgi:hypothetical protein